MQHRLQNLLVANRDGQQTPVGGLPGADVAGGASHFVLTAFERYGTCAGRPTGHQVVFVDEEMWNVQCNP
jgi:hypothetical protein